MCSSQRETAWRVVCRSEVEMSRRVERTLVSEGDGAADGIGDQARVRDAVQVEHALAEGDGMVCGVRRWRPDVRSSGGMAGKGMWALRGGRDAVWEGGQLMVGSRETRSVVVRSVIIHLSVGLVDNTKII